MFLCGVMCLFLWQASICPVQGQGSETINNANNNGPNSNSIGTKNIVIQRGDTLWHLAHKYETTVNELVKLNQVKSPDQIREGQSLLIPSAKTAEIAVTKEKSEDLATLDVKDSTENVVATLSEVREEKVVDATWWVTIIRNIPMVAMVYEQGYKTVNSNDFLPSLTKQEIETYEIAVIQNTEPTKKISIDELTDINDDRSKLETYKSGSTPAEKQIHSRGLGRLVTQEELELLSRVIHAEARGENFEGQVAVGAVVLNRMKDSRFPNTLSGVVYQSGAFTAVNDKQIHLNPNEQSFKAAEAAFSGLDPSNGAIFYYNPRIATDQWIKSRTIIKSIGNHTFSI